MICGRPDDVAIRLDARARREEAERLVDAPEREPCEIRRARSLGDPLSRELEVRGSGDERRLKGASIHCVGAGRLGPSSTFTGSERVERRGALQLRDRNDAAVPEEVLPDSGRERACVEVRHRAVVASSTQRGSPVSKTQARSRCVSRSICLVERTESVTSVSATTTGQRNPQPFREEDGERDERADRECVDELQGLRSRSPRRAATAESC